MSKIIGGSAFGIGDALIDTTDAVLIDGVSVAAIGAVRQSGVETAIALNIEGRINHSTERSDVVYLLNAEGAASIISDLLGVAARIDHDFLVRLLAQIETLPRRGEGTP